MNLKTSQKESPCVLLVEGQSDKHVILHLCRKSPFFSITRGEEIGFTDSPSSFVVKDKGGNSSLLNSIANEMKVSGRIAVGILMDANSDLKKRWGEIKDQLNEFDINFPKNPDDKGIIIDNNIPRIGVWLMPDNKNIGEIENFVAEMIPESDPVWPMSQKYIEDIPQEHKRFLPEKSIKASLYSWLAATKNPGLMGKTIGEGDLNIDVDICKKFLSWLEKLFKYSQNHSSSGLS